MTRYAVAYDRPTSRDVVTIHLGDFHALIDAQSLLRQLLDESKSNVRVRTRQVTEYVDVLESVI